MGKGFRDRVTRVKAAAGFPLCPGWWAPGARGSDPISQACSPPPPGGRKAALPWSPRVGAGSTFSSWNNGFPRHGPLSL